MAWHALTSSKIGSSTSLPSSSSTKLGKRTPSEKKLKTKHNPSSPSQSKSKSPLMASQGELQCVGRMEIARPKPVGFLCGSIPVLTDTAFHHNNAFNSSALVPSSSSQPSVKAPRYRMLPTETDLKSPPLLPDPPPFQQVMPVPVVNPRNSPGGANIVSVG